MHLRGEYTCRQSCPANDVAVRVSLLGCRVIGRNTPAADARAVGRPAERKVESSGRVSRGFISRTKGRTVSGRLRRHRWLPGGLAVSGHSSTGEQKPARRRRAVQQLNEADQPPRRHSKAILGGRVIGRWLAAYLGRWAAHRHHAERRAKAVHMLIDRNIQGLITDFTCGFCSAQSGYEFAFAGHSEWRGSWGGLCEGRAIAVLECRNCKMLNVLTFKVDEDDNEWPMTDWELGPYLAEHPEIIEARYDSSQDTISPVWVALIGQYPHGHKLSNSIPALVRQDLKEAGNCLAVGAFDAAVIMSRRVVERLAAHAGVKPDKGRMLGETLKMLEQKKLIDEALLKAFREIKEWGNIGTHPSEDDEGLSMADAKTIVEFVHQVVDQIFPTADIRSTTDELRQRRENRTA